MKRTIKNIIFAVLIILTGIAMFFTMNYVKNNTSSNENNQNQMKETSNVPPNMNENGNSSSENDLGNNNGTSKNSKEPPEKKEDSNTTNNEQDTSNKAEPPEKPNEENNNLKNNSIPNNTMNMNESSDIGIIYYVLFGVESLILAGLIIYLVMSMFNKKSIKEVFVNKDKVIICILLLIILTFGLTFLDTKITKDYFLSNSTNKENTKNESSATYSATNEIKKDSNITSGKYSSSNSDENALLLSGNINTKLSNIKVTKTGDSDGGDNTSFYGTNSAIVAKDGANVNLKNITINTSATGANGVFSYGGSATTNNSSSDNTKITISNSNITTTKDNSGGIMTTGGGTMKATNLTINTSGISSAAIRTDRGGGTATVNKGTYTTTGKGSPSIYSTANIKVSNANLISKKSEGIVIEGKNSVNINNCNLTDSNTELNGQSTTYKNIFLYQSMSGDAADGVAKFTSTNSTITTNNGDSFYVTNTTATINLTNNKIINNDSNGNFLRIQKDSWGKSGENGGTVKLKMTKQKVSGNIVVDSISTLDMKMKSNSYYEGTINGDNSAKKISLTLDKTSKIKLTGDSYVTSLNNSVSTNSNIDFNGYKLYVNGNAIN